MKKQLQLLILGLIILETSVSLGVADTGTGVRFVEGEAVEEIFTFEDVILQTSYKRSEDFSAGWRITGNKAVDIQLNVLQNPSNKTILVEHLHIDVFIESEFESFDDITQDSMDDYFHGIQGGFLIDKNFSYYETFSIEGSSPSFQKTYGYVYNSYYHSSETYNVKFSEEKLIENGGVWGNSLYFVFDVCMKNAEAKYFHKYIITNNIIIDLEGNAYNNDGNALDEYTEEEPFVMPWWGWLLIFIGVCAAVIFIAWAMHDRY